MKRKMKRAGLTSVQIRPDIARQMARYLEQGLSKSEMINEALRQYFIDKDIQAVREQMTPYGKAKGLYTDKDVEKFFG